MDNQPENLSLGEILRRIQLYGSALLQAWYVVLASIVVFALLFFLSSLGDRPVYTGTATFEIKEGGKGSGGGRAVGSILGQIGLGSGGGDASGTSSILGLAKTRMIIQRMLNDTVKTDEGYMLIGNAYLRDKADEFEKLDRERLLSGFFSSLDTISTMEANDRRLFLRLYREFAIDDGTGLPVVSLEYDLGTKFYEITARTNSETLSSAIPIALFDRLKDEYKARSTERSQTNYASVKERKDSIERELKTVEYQLAKLLDRSSGIISRVNSVRTAELERQGQLLSLIYAEVIKSEEAAAFILKNETPAFQLIDEPITPLPVEATSVIKQAVLGGVFGLFLSCFLIVGRAIYLQAIKELN